jgi:hypothetical protein
VYDGHRSEAKLLSPTTTPSAEDIMFAAWQVYLTFRNLLNRIPNRVTDFDSFAHGWWIVVDFHRRLPCTVGKAVRIK